MLENEAVIFEATPRAPLAAVAIAAAAAAAASWIEAPSPALGAAAISDGIGCVPDGGVDGVAAPVADDSVPCWDPFWLGYAGCPTAPLGASSADSDPLPSVAGPSAGAASSAAPRSSVIPGESSPAARDDSTRLSTRPPQHGSLTRGYLPRQLPLIRPNQLPSPPASASPYDDLAVRDVATWPLTRPGSLPDEVPRPRTTRQLRLPPGTIHARQPAPLRTFGLLGTSQESRGGLATHGRLRCPGRNRRPRRRPAHRTRPLHHQPWSRPAPRLRRCRWPRRSGRSPRGSDLRRD